MKSIFESAKDILNENGPPIGPSDKSAIYRVIKAFDMADDSSEILAGILKADRKTQNFMLAIITELDDNPTLLRTLVKSYRGE